MRDVLSQCVPASLCVAIVGFKTYESWVAVNVRVRFKQLLHTAVAVLKQRLRHLHYTTVEVSGYFCTCSSGYLWCVGRLYGCPVTCGCGRSKSVQCVTVWETNHTKGDIAQCESRANCPFKQSALLLWVADISSAAFLLLHIFFCFKGDSVTLIRGMSPLILPAWGFQSNIIKGLISKGGNLFAGLF